MKLIRKLGATSQIFQIFIADSSSSTGAGLTGLAYNSSSLTAYYHRDTDTTATAISLVTMTVGTFTSSGFKEIDSTNMPGWYQFCPPDAALATGAKSVAFHLKGATNMAPLPIEVDLDAQVDVTSWNGTAVASPATAGIPDVNAKNINNVATTSVTTINANVGTTQPTNFTGTGGSALVKSDTVNFGGSAGTFASGIPAVNATQFSGTATGSAAIGSVTGAVGSVAGDVSGKVIGGGVSSITGTGVRAVDSSGNAIAPASTALSTAQWTNTLATNLGTTNTTVAANLDATVSSRSTLTQTQVTGGAYSIQSSFCVLGDTRIANLDATVSSRAPSSTALSTAQWTNTRAGYLDNLSGGAVALASTALSSATWTSARAGYLDNLNVGGAVASQADVNAISVSATRRVLLSTVNYYERPESGSTSYQIELRTYSSTGSAVNADTTPTLTVTGIVSGSLSGNLSAATNPSTGVYRWTYTVASDATAEQIRFDVSAAISSATFTMSTYSQVLDEVSATWTSTDATHLTAIFNKLPTNNIADQTLLNTSIAGVQSDTDDIQSRLPAALVSGRMDVSVGAMASGVLTASAIAAAALNGKGDWLLSSSYTTPPTAAANASAVRTELATELSRIDVGVSTRLPTSSYTAPLDAAGTRTALGLGAANMDTQFNAIYVVAGLVQSQTDKLLFDGSSYVKTTPQTAAVGFYQNFLLDHGFTIPQDGSVIGSIANLDLHLSSAGVTAITEGVVDQTLSGHEIVGSVGEALVHASSAGDPWDIHLPGSYASGTAGKIVGDYLDAAISSRLAASSYTAPANPTDYARDDVTPSWYEAPVSLTAAEVWAYPDRTLAAAALDAIMVATNIDAGRIVDSDGNPVTSLNMRQAVALLMAYCAGDRTGIGTREIIAALAGETTKITATRTSQTVIQGTGVVPA